MRNSIGTKQGVGLVLRLGACFGLLASAAIAVVPGEARATTCDQTADLVARACVRKAEAGQLVSLASCANVSNAGQSARCVDRANSELDVAESQCQAQRRARANVCGAIGQDPYDPPINPANFTTRISNRYFPLRRGTTLIYRGEESETKVTVTDKTRKILGVNCVVVRDTVYVKGQVEEDTFDYYAQDRTGNVWYFGESTAEYVNGYIVSSDGTFIAGEAGAKPGIIMAVNPVPGTTVRQEFALDEAEDIARYESLGGALKTRFRTFQNVLKTFETTPLEPTAMENKYYAPNIGNVATVDLATGEREVLVDIEK